MLGWTYQWNNRRRAEAEARKCHGDNRGKPAIGPVVDDLYLIMNSSNLAKKVNLPIPVKNNQKTLDYEEGQSE